MGEIVGEAVLHNHFFKANVTAIMDVLFHLRVVVILKPYLRQ